MKHLIIAGLASALLGTSFSASAATSSLCFAETEAASTEQTQIPRLPQRTGAPTKTSGRVPHVQINVDPVPAVNEKLYQLAFSLPGVEKRPTIVSLPGTNGMWLRDRLPVAHPKAIVAGREFAHIHTDGSLHAPLPYERALELSERGWGERHPWADRRDGWEGFVMLYTPQSMQELSVTFQLIVESYNYVTGKNLGVVDC